MARHAKRLPAGNFISRTTIPALVSPMHHRTDVIGMGLCLAGTHPAASPALPSISSQHCEPPCLMTFVGVASLICVGPQCVWVDCIAKPWGFGSWYA
jgi:hypothetical protein